MFVGSANIANLTDLKKYCLIFFCLTLCGYSFSSDPSSRFDKNGLQKFTRLPLKLVNLQTSQKGDFCALY